MRWFRRLVIVGVALVLLLLVARLGVDVWAKRRVSVQRAALEAQFGSLDVSTLQVPPVPESENRARILRAAVALVAGHDERQQSMREFQAKRAPTPVPADLRAFVDQNRDALRLAVDAAGRPRANWEVDYATGGNAPGLLEIRRLSSALYFDARIALDEGRPDDAARALGAGLALAASLRQEPSLISQLIRCAVALQHFEGVQRLLAGSEPSEPALASLAERLAENREPSPMHIGFMGELKTFNALLGRAAEGETASFFVPNQGVSWWGRPASWVMRPWARMMHAQYLEQLGALIDAERGPRPRAAVVPSASSGPRLFPTAAPGLERAMDTGDQHNSALAMAELAVAVRRHRLAKGTYPADLSAVAPAYIASVPSDALNGKPFSYARQDSGFTLRSEHPKALERQSASTLTWTVTR